MAIGLDAIIEKFEDKFVKELAELEKEANEGCAAGVGVMLSPGMGISSTGSSCEVVGSVGRRTQVTKKRGRNAHSKVQDHPHSRGRNLKMNKSCQFQSECPATLDSLEYDIGLPTLIASINEDIEDEVTKLENDVNKDCEDEYEVSLPTYDFLSSEVMTTCDAGD